MALQDGELSAVAALRDAAAAVPQVVGVADLRDAEEQAAELWGVEAVP